MAALSLVFDIVGKDNASSAFNNVGDAADKSGSKLGKLGGVAKVAGLGLAGAAVGGVALLASALKDGAAEYAGNEAAAAQLTATIKSTGNVAGITTAGITALADSIEAKTGTDGAAVVSGAALLATFTNVKNAAGEGANVFDRATQAGVDLAAKGFGSVEGNAVLLGKALNDPIKGLTALGKQGVSFTEEQKGLIKSLVATGDTLGAQKIILGEVEKQVGGSAEAYGKTLPGQLARAQAAFDGVKETLFKALLPAFIKAVDFMTGTFLPTLGRIADAVGPAFATLATVLQTKVLPASAAVASGFKALLAAIPTPLLAAIAAAVGVIGGAMLVSAAGTAIATTATTIYTAATAAMNAVLLLNPFVAAAAALAALVAGLVVAYRQSETFRNIVNGAFNAVRTVVIGAINAVTNIVRGGINVLVGIFTGDLGRIKQGASAAFGGVITLVGAVPKRILGALGNLGGLLVDAGGDLMRGLANGITGAIADVKRAAVNAAQAAVNSVKGALGINSPSRVFAELGRFSGAGLAAGLNASQGLVGRAATDLLDLTGMKAGGSSFINGRLSVDNGGDLTEQTAWERMIASNERLEAAFRAQTDAQVRLKRTGAL